ncbi:RHS repeat-associated core domain-containing protein [Streptomyces sp. Tu 6176]|uniref:RHS repeat-associated core domain-containing protein n=1 Tax=Streptomyces sp. Tu 6176 TaxID=1470557 RepID=UPI000B22C01D
MTTLAVTRRKQLPFGENRSTQTGAIPGTRGFVGGTTDPTGLIHLGAREYDPTLGRFLSVDPVIDTDDPAQMNAYSYAHNNPVTKSDPDGLRPDGPAGGASYNDDRWGQDRGMSVGYTYDNGKWRWHQTPLKDPESRTKYKKYRSDPANYNVFHYNEKAAARAKAQAQARAKARAAARAKAEAEHRKKKDGIFGWVKKGVSAAHSFMQEHSTALGVAGVALGVASMITPLGWIATAAMVGGFVLGAATTVDACASKQWGGCVMGAASLGMAGVGLGASKVATSALRAAADAGVFSRTLLKVGAKLSRVTAGVANTSSVGYATIGTVTGGNLGNSSPMEDE